MLVMSAKVVAETNQQFVFFDVEFALSIQFFEEITHPSHSLFSVESKLVQFPYVYLLGFVKNRLVRNFTNGLITICLRNKTKNTINTT